MKTIDHLSREEQQHYILCHCGEYLDMRNLSQVFTHQHVSLPQPEWNYSVKKGEPIANPKSGKRISLN